ncbi:lactate utilization protein C [Streptomyces sp. NPDC087422]|uniref:LutC/YkgG family protein n=1 Tax=Streptomyces sp. NPDC087422 TaxID=3365786 RepID=UPI003821118A
MTSRDTVLTRIRNALADVPRDDHPHDTPLTRDYLHTHADRTPQETATLLAENLTDYRAHVHHTDETGLPATVARLIAEHGSRSLVTPQGLPAHWLDAIGPDTERHTDRPEQTTYDLDAIDTVITGCALAIAETGTIVLDTSPDQGRRRITLVPDHHICVITPAQIVASVPQALPRLDPTRPQTWISGPSATSDIELDRVEGVHGPRTLDVIMVV